MICSSAYSYYHESEWTIDPNASFYIVPCREFFFYYKANNFGTISMGNNGVLMIVGSSNVVLDTNIECTLRL